MKKLLAALTLVCVFLSSCGTKLPEKKISFDDHEGVTIEYTCTTPDGETKGKIAYKKTESGFVFYEIASDGSEYVCETEGENQGSFVRVKGADKFTYQQVDFGDGSTFTDDAAYYRYNFAYYGFDYEKELGELEFSKQGEGKVSGRDCYEYTAQYDGSEMKISVDKESGIWLRVEEGDVVYTVTGFTLNADIIPQYR